MNPSGTKYLETERLSLRRITLNDVGDFHKEILGNKERLLYLDWVHATNISATKIFVENVIESYKKDFYFFWFIEEKFLLGFVGCIFVSSSDEKKRLAEIEYVACKKKQGHGYMTEALKKVIDFLFREVGYYRVEGVCNIDNEASARVMEKAGMIFEGILRGRALNLNSDGNPGDLKMYSTLSSGRS